MDRIETTLCLLKRDNKILLAMKKRGFGKGKYNGIGGKIEKNITKYKLIKTNIKFILFIIQ